jgi:glyoxylase-like metal-dependent hydrolase (beta-lactamase superfamily II)
MPLEIIRTSVGPMDNIAYLLRDPDAGEALLIDAANDGDTLLGLLRSPAELKTVVTTHQHPDHWQALGQVVTATGASSVAHPEDAEPLPVTPDRLVQDGDTVAVGAHELLVIHLVGHTPGSIALLWEDPAGPPQIFTGDSLFPGGPGNTWGNAEAFTTLMDDLERKVFGVLPDETLVHPGHGAGTTIGAERPSLPEWRARGW